MRKRRRRRPRRRRRTEAPDGRARIPHSLAPRRSLTAVAAAALRCSPAASSARTTSAPRSQAPAAYLYPAGQDAALADVEWWKAFGDPVLDGLIAEALANNRNIAIAAANVEQAAGVLQSTRSALLSAGGLPGATPGAAASPATASPRRAAGISNPTNFYQALAGASWEIDLWGRVQRLSESAQASVLATEEARRGVILTLVANVANAYLQLRGLDEQLAMAQHTRDAYAESLRLMEAKFQYGRVSQMNVDQATARLQAAEVQIPRLQRDIGLVAGRDLPILLGRNPGPIARGKSIFEIALPAVPAGVPSQLLERRPDLAQAEQQLIAANAQIGAAKALYYPTISLTGALGTASTDLSNLFKGATRNWNYAGMIAGPIFTGGAIAGQVAQAEGAQRAALQSYQLAIQSAFADVDNALALAQHADRAARGAGEAGHRAARLLAHGATAVRRRPRALLDRAAGRAGAVPGRARLGRRPGAAVLVDRRHLQGDGRRLGGGGGQAHRRRTPASAPQ